MLLITNTAKDSSVSMSLIFIQVVVVYYKVISLFTESEMIIW